MRASSRRFPRVIRYAVGALASLSPLAAWGEAAPAADQPDGSSLEQIVVTAQKRAENLQSVPIAVTALSGELVDKLHANSLIDLTGQVPSIQIDHHSNTPNSAVLYIRGMGIEEADPYAGNTVSVVVDGVPQFFNMGALLDLFDIERVEVLRGPQGTLFGANTTGGVVNVITKQPTGQFGGYAELTYGNWNRLDGHAAIDLPLIPGVLAGKIAASHTQRTGWITNIVDGNSMGGVNNNAGRVYLRYTPTEDFDATLIGGIVAARDGAPVVVNGGIPGEALYVAPGTIIPGSSQPMYASPCAPNSPCRAPGKYLSANDSTADISDMNTYIGTLTANWRNTALGDLTSITGYKKFNLLEETDQDGTPEFLLDTRRHTVGRQISEELRSAFNLSDLGNMIVGAFYMKTHYDHLHSLRVQFAVPGLDQQNRQTQDNYSASAFAQAYFNLTQRLRMQVGVRYQHEQTRMEASTLNYIDLSGIAQFSGGIPLGGITPSGSKSWNNYGAKLGLDYKWGEQSLLYGYAARGFKDGGFVGRVGIPQDIGPYAPETVYTYEVGTKVDWLDKRLRTNLAVFYTDYRNMQLAQNYFAPDSGGGFVQGNTILNAAKAKIKGVEFDAAVIPFQGLTLNASVAYLDAKYSQFPFTAISALGSSVIDLAGYRLQNAPEWSGSASARYEFKVGGGGLATELTYTYTGQKFLDALNDTPRSSIQPTNYVNGNVDWTPAGGAWSVGLWARNIFDKRYVDNVFDAPGTFAFVSYAAPREYGATVRFNF
jgi:iron complex outermembrane receptor protein